LPIVARRDRTIIDGFHRWLVAGREPLANLLRTGDGIMVPVVTVEHEDPARDIYGTITHNRARGVHQLGPMKEIIKQLLAAGKTVEEIGKELGMRGEEVFRLSDFDRSDFLALMATSSAGYSPAKLYLRT
jgi:hypothetical protein